MKEEEQVFYGRRWSFEEDKFIQDFAIRPGVEFETPHNKAVTCDRVTDQRIYYGTHRFVDKTNTAQEPGTRKIMNDLNQYQKGEKHLQNLEKAKEVFGSWEEFKRFESCVRKPMTYREEFNLSVLDAIFKEYEDETPPEVVAQLLKARPVHLSGRWNPISEILKACNNEGYNCDCDSPYIQLTEEAFRMVCDKMMRPYRKLKEERNGVPA